MFWNDYDRIREDIIGLDDGPMKEVCDSELLNILYLLDLDPIDPADFHDLFDYASEDAISLLQRMLVFSRGGYVINN